MESEKQYDVLIVGAGLAGIGAALETSRSGLRTALIEKTILPGGLVTSGLVPIYMVLCNGKGRQVTFGIAEELLKYSIKYGPGSISGRWNKGPKVDVDLKLDALYSEGHLGDRYAAAFSPPAFVFGLDEVLYNTDVDIWYDTLACLPVMKGSKITGVEVENKSGRIFIGASCIIDATGDADIAYRAGAKCREKGSYPSFLYQTVSLKRAKEAANKNSASFLSLWHSGGGADEFDRGYEGESGIYTGTNGKSISEFVIESRKIAREKLMSEQKDEFGIGRENFYPAAVPIMPQIRMIRCIEGEETVKTNKRNSYIENSVGLIADCRKTDAVWEVPYGALLPKEVDNLLVAGRCISAENYAWQITRLVVPAVFTGQIAGIAAELAVSGKTSPNKLNIKDVQKTVEDKGIVLHI